MYHFSIFQLYMYARAYVRILTYAPAVLFKRYEVSTVEIHLDSMDNLSTKKQGFGKTEVRLHSNMAKVRGSKL